MTKKELKEIIKKKKKDQKEKLIMPISPRAGHSEALIEMPLREIREEEYALREYLIRDDPFNADVWETMRR